MGQEWWARSCKVNRTNVILFAIVYIVLYGSLSHNEFDVSFILLALSSCSNGQFCLSLYVILILTYTLDIDFLLGKRILSDAYFRCGSLINGSAGFNFPQMQQPENQEHKDL